MKVIISHPTGNSNLRAVIKSFAKNKILAEFHTTVAVNSNSGILKLIPEKVKKDLLRRVYPIEDKYINKHPFKEFARLILPKIGLSSFTKHEKGIFSVDSVYKSLDLKVANRLKEKNRRNLFKAVYNYEDGALETFKTAKDLNVTCFYDLPIGYWKAFRSMMENELLKRPEWAKTLTGFQDSDEKLKRKDKELALADHIFVASTFTKKTLEYYGENLAPISVIPYGFPEVTKNREYEPMIDRPLKLLFVGGLSQRKGIANILEAVEELGNAVELTIIGKKSVEDCEPLNVGLKKHTYIPGLPHHEILETMREHDVLLFPSLFEGFGLVVTEAMSQGTPVITTDRTCGPDIIKHGENGWIIEAGNTKALRNQINAILENPQSMITAGKNAISTAEKRPWSEYGRELSEKIKSILS